MTINGGQMIFRTTTVRGFWLASWLRRAPADTQRSVMGEVLAHMASGAIVPAVEATYDLSDVTEAVRHAEKPGRHGKVLLVG